MVDHPGRLLGIFRPLHDLHVVKLSYQHQGGCQEYPRDNQQSIPGKIVFHYLPPLFIASRLSALIDPMKNMTPDMAAIPAAYTDNPNTVF
jgi:hypothetical protein